MRNRWIVIASCPAAARRGVSTSERWGWVVSTLKKGRSTGAWIVVVMEFVLSDVLAPDLIRAALPEPATTESVAWV